MPKYATKYEHFIPECQPDPRFPDGYSRIYIGSLEALKTALSNPAPYMSFDTETSGLNAAKDFIVGFSFSFDGITGYYVPVKHAEGVSLGQWALNLLYDRMRCKVTKRIFTFNTRFDFRMMEYAGYNMESIPYYDVSIGCWMADTNVKMPSLKASARRFLGWQMTLFEEALGDKTNFYYVDPETATKYAAVDALATFRLAMVTIKYYNESGKAGELDNELLYPLMKFENVQNLVDVRLLEEIEAKTKAEIFRLEEAIYSHVGYRFSINSGKQLSDAFDKLGINTGAYVKAGYQQTSMKLLEPMLKKPGYAESGFLKDLVRYKVLIKALNSYISTLRETAQENGGWVRFAYITNNVPTGRLASGSDRKNTFFAKINAQSIPKPKVKFWNVRAATPDEIAAELDVAGYMFYLDEDIPKYGPTTKIIEAFDPELNIRRAIVPPKGFLHVSIDFSAQELRIPSNFSGEPVWVEAFVNGEDVHKKTAMALYPNEQYDKSKRKKAKIANFSILYGATKYTMAEKLEMTPEEGEIFIAQFKKALPVLFAWVDAVCRRAKKEGTVYTAFSRPRRVRFWFNSAEGKERAFAYRTAVNTKIQGTGADILKIALIRAWKNVMNHPDYKTICTFLSTIHDEINYAVLRNRVYDVVPRLVQCMALKIPEWKVPMDVGIEIGTSWGMTFPFILTPEGKLIPKWEDKPDLSGGAPAPDEVPEDVFADIDMSEDDDENGEDF